MQRENVVFAVCGFILGLIAGAFTLGPWVAGLRGSAATASTPAVQSQPMAADRAPAADTTSSSAANSAVMSGIFQEIEMLRRRVEANPRDFDALVRLGNLYMDAVKWEQAADYYARAVSIRRDPDVITDLGICYRQTGRPEEALKLFESVQRNHPEHWQSAFNQAIALADLKRFDEARVVVASLKKLRPNDPEVERLEKALSTL
jgi:tetratricopeptide (TPR) repeat protein